jgi:serine/threonine protein kinase
MADFPFPPVQSCIKDYCLRYKIAEKPLSTFFMPSVHYLAESSDGSYVVIKCCYVTEANESALANEGTLMEEAQSIWTVRSRDIFRHESGGHCYSCIAMSYYASGWDGVQLTADENYYSELCYDVINAIAVLHSRGIWHRDVNKANIFLTGYSTADGYDVHAFLGDFGFAYANTGDPPPPVVGTDGYLAPELIAEAPCMIAF